jgi:hypothetical protein
LQPKQGNVTGKKILILFSKYTVKKHTKLIKDQNECKKRRRSINLTQKTTSQTSFGDQNLDVVIVPSTSSTTNANFDIYSQVTLDLANKPQNLDIDFETSFLSKNFNEIISSGQSTVDENEKDMGLNLDCSDDQTRQME